MSTLLLEVNGIEYQNFTDADVNCQLDSIAGSFGFSAVSTEKNPLPIKQGDSCKITADGEVILTGFIETLDVDYDASSHSISLSGRSKTADIIDSSIFKLEIKAPISLKEVIQKVITHIGASIEVIDNVGNIEIFNAAEDIVSAEVGENAFDFIEKYSRKRQVLLTTDGDGNVVITNSGTDVGPISLQNIIGGDANNIEGASVSYDDTERFNTYQIKSQLNPVTANVAGDTTADALVDQKSGAIIDLSIRESRQLLIQAESSSSNKQTKLRAEWEANIRETRSITYSTTVQNFSENGKLWRINQLVSINDEFAGINDQMLITTVDYGLATDGSYAILTFVNKNAYTLKLNEPTKGGKLGEGLT